MTGNGEPIGDPTEEPAEAADEPLTRDEVAAVIEGRSAGRRVPLLFHFWVGTDGAPDWQRQASAILARYPMDVQVIPFRIPQVYDAPADEPEYRWVSFDAPASAGEGGLDAQVAIGDWSRLDEVLAAFPDPRSPHLFDPSPPPDGRYRLGHWWYWLFERHWSLRGMENALLDFHCYPIEVKRLYRALTDFYLVAIERGKNELGLDGIFTSDDLGGQQGPMFSPAVFAEFFAPYYKEIIDRAHSLDMHLWLHCCGNVARFIPTLVDLGLDVLHPIQKYTMDERAIAAEFGGRICFWSGFDVQRIIPWGTPEEVRREARYLLETYRRPEGRLMLTAGNVIHEDCPPASLEALLDESLRAGRTPGYVEPN